MATSEIEFSPSPMIITDGLVTEDQRSTLFFVQDLTDDLHALLCVMDDISALPSLLGSEKRA